MCAIVRHIKEALAADDARVVNKHVHLPKVLDRLVGEAVHRSAVADVGDVRARLGAERADLVGYASLEDANSAANKSTAYRQPWRLPR